MGVLLSTIFFYFTMEIVRWKILWCTSIFSFLEKTTLGLYIYVELVDFLIMFDVGNKQKDVPRIWS